VHVGGRDLANKSPDLSLLRIHPRKFESDSSCSFDHTLPTLPTQPTDPRGSPPLDSGLLGAGARRNAHSEHNERSGRSGCNGDTLQHLDQDRRHNRRTGSKACIPRTRLCSSLDAAWKVFRSHTPAPPGRPALSRRQSDEAHLQPPKSQAAQISGIEQQSSQMETFAKVASLAVDYLPAHFQAKLHRDRSLVRLQRLGTSLCLCPSNDHCGCSST